MTETNKPRPSRLDRAYIAAELYGRSRRPGKPLVPSAASLRNPKRQVPDSEPV